MDKSWRALTKVANEFAREATMARLRATYGGETNDEIRFEIKRQLYELGMSPEEIEKL